MDENNQIGKAGLRNYMEDCVDDSMNSILETINICTCEICRLDIKAIALNSLPPKYVVTKKGKLYAKLFALQQQFDVDIISAVTKAAIMVGRNPRHDQDQD